MKLNEGTIATLPRPVDEPQAYYWDDEVTGFGVCVARTGRITYYARRRVTGKLVKIKIGVAGELREDKQKWSVRLARERARELIGTMAGGTVPKAIVDPNAGPTLREARELHVANMEKKNKSPKSIGNVRYYLEKYVPELLDQPLAAITGETLVMVHDRIKEQARPITGAVNTRGAATANKVILTFSACWNSLNKKLGGKLGNWNPAKSVVHDTIKPKRTRVAEHDLPDWYVRVQSIDNSIRRDLQLFMLFTAMRDTAATHVRWDDLVLAHPHLPPHLHVPNPKGGEAKAFDLPLGPTLIELFARRRDQNAFAMRAFGGDHGFVFPTVNHAGIVVPIVESKEQRTEVREDRTGKKTKHKVQYLPGPHTLRRTYLSIAREAGVSELDSHVLANHAFGTQTVNARYIEQAMPHLTRCQEKIDAALWARLTPKKPAKVTARSPKTRAA